MGRGGVKGWWCLIGGFRGGVFGQCVGWSFGGG